MNSAFRWVSCAGSGRTVLAVAQAGASELRVQLFRRVTSVKTGDIAKRFEAANAGVKIVIDKVPYKAVTEQRRCRYSWRREGQADIARVTDLGQPVNTP